MAAVRAARRISKADQEALYRAQMGENAAERQKRDAATKCKSCFAPIIWTVVRRSGKRMPIDHDPDDAGNVFYYEHDGTIEVATQSASLPPRATRHFSHFATCPNADAHRVPAGPADAARRSGR